MGVFGMELSFLVLLFHQGWAIMGKKIYKVLI